MPIVLSGPAADDGALAIEEREPTIATVLTDDGAVVRVDPVSDLAAYVLAAGADRWVWGSTVDWYPGLLAAGVRVERCHDLALAHAILRDSVLVADRLGEAAPDPVEEYRRQRAAVATSSEPGRLDLLLAAESAGALVAVELRYAGLPWSREAHERILVDQLGPRPQDGARPDALVRLHAEIEAALDGATVNPDSPADLLKALRAAGIRVGSTRSWELQRIDHPVIPPLLEYRALARLATANGWHWLDQWVRDGRFRPEYVPGGVVTGRWASSGGGALQLPRQVRGAVRADPGWRLVVADAAQLEPRILAAMAGDAAMTAAGAGGDLYAGLVAAGVVAERPQAKVAMLAALYGATTGDSGRLLPRLAKAYPQAMGLVERAARDGEQGHAVRTWLGRSSPTRDIGDWSPGQQRAWGRFTRNFIVQGTAAEWALCWIGGIRGRLTRAFPGAWPDAVPHLVFFLHDEVIVHAPAADAEQAATIVRDAAAEAGRLLFGEAGPAFPIAVAVVDDYASAK